MRDQAEPLVNPCHHDHDMPPTKARPESEYLGTAPVHVLRSLYDSTGSPSALREMIRRGVSP